jgi:hypothetical protein
MNPPDQPTPRTDAALLNSDCACNCGHNFKLLILEKYDQGKCVYTGPDFAHGNDGVVVLADFARTLEHELTLLRAEVERLTVACNKFSNDEIAQGDWKARAEKAEAALTSPPLLTGKLTHAGTCYIGEEHTDGVFIAIDREQLKALSRLPMYDQIELRAMKGTPSTL